MDSQRKKEIERSARFRIAWHMLLSSMGTFAVYALLKFYGMDHITAAVIALGGAIAGSVQVAGHSADVILEEIRETRDKAEEALRGMKENSRLHS